MAWVKLDDKFFVNKKARAVGSEGRALALASWCYCAMQENDGVFPVSDVPIVAAWADVPVEVGDRLIEAGLWDAIEGDRIQVHDYLKHNPSSEEIRIRRERAERAAAARHATSNATSRPPGNATSQPQSSPSPLDESSSSSSSSDLVPEAVWVEVAKKKAADPANKVNNFARWSPTVIANDKADHGQDAAWIWETYEITVPQLAAIIHSGSRSILNSLRKREDPAA